uniref:DUF4158 domain-containing protein n=1 Tax=Steinernema glaseri TaxID=37863 RepID=A0A1I7ZK77_9BILA
MSIDKTEFDLCPPKNFVTLRPLFAGHQSLVRSERGFRLLFLHGDPLTLKQPLNQYVLTVMQTRLLRGQRQRCRQGLKCPTIGQHAHLCTIVFQRCFALLSRNPPCYG